MHDDFTSRRLWLARTAAAGATLCLGPLARAQGDWPSRPIKFIVPYAAGGATDILARLIAEKVSGRLGQPVVIDNRGGAGGILGTDATAKAAPDGYTFVVSLGTSLLTNQFLYEKLPYNMQRDLALVSQIAVAPLTLAVHPSVPANTGPELLQYVARNKGKVSYGSWGVGSPAHLSGAYMSLKQQADMTHVAYKGEAPMLQDLIGGQIQMAFASALGTKPHAEAGRLKFIGVTGEQRMGVLPNVPTLLEQGLKDDAYRVASFIGMAAPAKTSAALVDRMAKEVAAACQIPEVRERIVAMGFIPVASTPQAFAAAYKKDYVVLEKLVKDSGAKLD